MSDPHRNPTLILWREWPAHASAEARGWIASDDSPSIVLHGTVAEAVKALLADCADDHQERERLHAGSLEIVPRDPCGRCTACLLGHDPCEGVEPQPKPSKTYKDWPPAEGEQPALLPPGLRLDGKPASKATLVRHARRARRALANLIWTVEQPGPIDLARLFALANDAAGEVAEITPEEA